MWSARWRLLFQCSKYCILLKNNAISKLTQLQSSWCHQIIERQASLRKMAEVFAKVPISFVTGRGLLCFLYIFLLGIIVHCSDIILVGVSLLCNISTFF